MKAWQYARWTSLLLTIVLGLWCLNGLPWAATTPVPGESSVNGKKMVYTTSATFSLLKVGANQVYTKYYDIATQQYFEDAGGMTLTLFYPYNVYIKAVDSMPQLDDDVKEKMKKFLVSCETGGMSMVVTGALAVALLLISIVLRLVDYCIWANEGEATSWYKYSAMLLPVLAFIMLVIGLVIFNTGCLGYTDPNSDGFYYKDLGIGPGFVLAGTSAAFVCIYAGLNCFAIIKGRDSEEYDKQTDAVALGAIGTATSPVQEQDNEQETDAKTRKDAEEHKTSNDTIAVGAYADAGDAPMFSGLTVGSSAFDDDNPYG